MREANVITTLNQYSTYMRILELQGKAIFESLPLSACQPDVFASGASSSLQRTPPVEKHKLLVSERGGNN